MYKYVKALVWRKGNIQGDQLSGKPGNVREFDSCQGNVGDFTKKSGKCQRNIREKILWGKSCLKLFIISCIFASIQVFSTSMGMIWVTLKSAAKCQGNVNKFHIVCRVVTLNINRTVSVLQYCSPYILWAVLACWSTGSVFDPAWFRSLFSEQWAPLYLQSSCCCIYLIFLLHPVLYLIVSWAWWDWSLTWLMNRCPTVLWHCWLGYLTHKIVPKMTCNVGC